MSEFYFFRKNNQIIPIESTDTKLRSLLIEDGWEKLFEEVQASAPEEALARLADIRKEEDMTEHAFITGSAFSGLLGAILK